MSGVGLDLDDVGEVSSVWSDRAVVLNSCCPPSYSGDLTFGPCRCCNDSTNQGHETDSLDELHGSDVITLCVLWLRNEVVFNDEGVLLMVECLRSGSVLSSYTADQRLIYGELDLVCSLLHHRALELGGPYYV